MEKTNRKIIPLTVCLCRPDDFNGKTAGRREKTGSPTIATTWVPNMPPGHRARAPPVG